MNIRSNAQPEQDVVYLVQEWLHPSLPECGGMGPEPAYGGLENSRTKGCQREGREGQAMYPVQSEAESACVMWHMHQQCTTCVQGEICATCIVTRNETQGPSGGQCVRR